MLFSKHMQKPWQLTQYDDDDDDNISNEKHLGAVTYEVYKTTWLLTYIFIIIIHDIKQL
jgi:hypothetical protein